MFTSLSSYSGYHHSEDGEYSANFSKLCFTKQFYKRKTISAPKCAKFKIESVYDPVNLTELEPTLREWLASPELLHIRGRYIKPSACVARKMGLVEDVASKVFMIDIDDIALDGIEYDDLEAQVEKCVSLLHACSPEIIGEDIAVLAQASSSAGVDTDRIKLHLFIQNNCALKQGQLKYFFEQLNRTYKEAFKTKYNLVDTAVFHPVQPLYLAAPIFSGVEDPFEGKDRIFYRKGGMTTIAKDTPNFKTRAIEVTEREHEFYTRLEGDIDIPLEVEQVVKDLEAWDTDRRGFRMRMCSAFHKALQKHYSIDQLEIILRPIVEAKRPGQSEAYFKDGRTTAIKKFIERSARLMPRELRGIPITPIKTDPTQHYVKLEVVPPDSITFLKASLGTGKTTTLQNWLKDGHINGSFLTITNTSALVESNAERFGAGDFRKQKDLIAFSVGKIRRLSGTIHSLWKVENLVDKFDVLFIDECDAVMNDILFASIIPNDKRVRILNTLHELLLNTNRVVLSDGDISEETVEAYLGLIDYARKVYSVDHQRDTLAEATAYHHKTPNSLWGALQGSLDLGEKCLLVSDVGPDELNKKQLALSEVTGRNIKVAHLSSKNDNDIKDVINNTTDALKRQYVDALLCSPTITNGVDFNYFDSVFVLTTSMIHSPNMRYQALRRDRGAKTIHYYFAPVNGYRTGIDTHLFEEGWKDRTERIYCQRRERESQYYLNTFQYYLLREGASIDTVVDPFDGLPSMEQIYHEQRCCAILSSTPDYIVPRHNDAYDVKQLIKYFFDLEGEPTMEDVELWLEHKPDKSCEFLHKVYLEFWPAIAKTAKTKNLDIMVDTLRANGYKFHRATGEEAALSKWKIQQYMRRLGFNKDMDNTDQVLAWYLKYLLYFDLPIPDSLQTEGEKMGDGI